jgi:flagellar basal-body rod protein FlgG
VTDGLTIAASGIQVAATRLDLVANNVANLTTPGFTPSAVDQVTLEGGGTAVGGIGLQGSPASLLLTPVGLQGNAFFQVDTPQGPRFTPSGWFTIDAAGNLFSIGGLPLSPPINFPLDAESILVMRDGRVLAVFADGSSTQVGQIQTFSFPNPGGLAKQGENLLVPTPASGPAEPVPVGQVVFQGGTPSGTDLARESVTANESGAAVQANVVALQVQDKTRGSLLDILG